MSNAEPVMWAHSYVRCQRCGYDSLEANEVHVYEADRERLECPHCRSLDCHPIDVDEARGAEPEDNTIEFDVPAELTVMSAVAVLDCSNAEGEPIVLLSGHEDIRKVQTMGLLSYGMEMVKERMHDEWGESPE